MTVALIHFNITQKDGMISWPSMRTSPHATNYGDVLVGDAIIRQVELEDFRYVGFGGVSSEECNKFIVRGSTYLFPTFDFESACKTIESVDGEGTIVGLGAQSPTNDIRLLDGNAGAHRFIALLNERCKSISVRGQFTADIVERLGGKNIRITGCPSLFHSRSTPEVRLPETFHTAERTVGISTHSWLQGIFCRDPKAAREAHKVMLSQSLATCRNVYFFEQGVRREFAVADRHAQYDNRIAAANVLIDLFSLDIEPGRLLSLYVMIESIEEWRGKVNDLDAMIGVRFHGNMMALMQGKPCYYVVYDSRLEEFCRLYKLPFQDVSETIRPFDAISDHNWDDTNEAFRRCGSEMKAFWLENGFEHRIV